MWAIVLLLEKYSSMRLVSFDLFRSLGCPGIHYVKPGHLIKQRRLIEAADFVLFPDYADINQLCFVMRKAVFPSLSSYLLGFNKVEMTLAFQNCCPINVPMTLILPNTPVYQSQALDEMPLPFVAKLPRSTRGEGVFLIETAADWRAYCDRADMLYVQEQLIIDRDLRIVWIGDHVVHAYWRVGAPGEFHNNVAHGGTIEVHDVPSAAIDLVTAVARRLHIDYAGFDVAMVNGHPFLFEFNRLFGMQGLNRAGINPGPIIHSFLERRYRTGGRLLSTEDPETDLQ